MALQCAHVTDKFFDGRFPYEDFQIHTNHVKVTGQQVKLALKEYWGRATAKTFFNQKNIVPLNEFNNIWWSGISKVMASYSKNVSNIHHKTGLWIVPVKQ
jgi:hypothetical protein